MARSSRFTSPFTIKRLRTIYILYWILLTYIIAALVWWFIALSRQNTIMTDYKRSEINPAQSNYTELVGKIEEERKRKTAQYIGEGVTFLLLIVVGAVAVFRAVRRQFRQSQQQQNFMMAITHELKTPIAVTRLNLETLQKHKLSEEKQQQLISSTLQEAGRLNSLCNNLLLASRIEAGDFTFTLENINLTDLITESVNDFKMRFPKRKLESDLDTEIFFSGDRLLLQMAVNNLLDNAIKYSDRDAGIGIQLKTKDEHIVLLVSDEGKGIPDEEKKNIFNKYYRVGNLYTREAKGTGLGLYLTEKIIQQHKGDISVKDNLPHGSIFEVKL